MLTFSVGNSKQFNLKGSLETAQKLCRWTDMLWLVHCWLWHPTILDKFAKVINYICGKYLMQLVIIQTKWFSIPWKIF